MKPEGSLKHSQVPATCPYPVPARSSPYHHILLPADPSWYYNLIYVRSSSLSLKFPHQTPVYASSLPHTRHMPSPSHSSRFYHPNNIGWWVQIIQLLIMQLPPFHCYLVPPRPKYSSQHPILKQSQPAFLPQCQRRSLKPIQTNRQNYSSVYLNL